MLIGASSAVVVEPSLTVGSTTNYNQNSAVFNAVVNTTGNRNITLVEFQHSPSSSFASGNSDWFTATTNSTITQGATSTACTYNATGLTASVAGTPSTYYVRFRTTNASGIVTTSSIGGSFNTYRLRTDPFTSSGTWTNPVQTSGTGGLAIDTLTQIVTIGGGGAGYWGGGAGGTLAVYTNVYVPGVTTVPVTIGAGGAFSGNGSTTSFGFFSGGGGLAGNQSGSTGTYGYGGAGNGRTGGTRSPNPGYGIPAAGGGAGAGSNGYNGSGMNGGNGGDAVFGFAGGGGGAAELYGGGGGTDGTPSGAGPANTARGGFTASSGGSGFCNVTYWGPY
jgi:hypothetical protein